jgi:hypothetical protein
VQQSSDLDNQVGFTLKTTTDKKIEDFVLVLVVAAVAGTAHMK